MKNLQGLPAPPLMGARVTNQAGDVIIVPVKRSDPLN
jgi:hypothetical protein